MLFFTHSQFSSATPPLLIDVQLKIGSGDSSPLDSTEAFLFDVLIKLPGSDTIASTDAVTLTYAIGTDTGKTVELNASSIAPPHFNYIGGVQVTEGDNGAITFTKVSFKTSSTGATPIDYTTATTSPKQVDFSVEGGTTISAQTPIEDITDVTSVKVKTSASGDDTTVTNGETVNVDVVVVNAAEGIAVVDTDAVTGDTTDHTLQYKIAGGASSDLALFLGDNNTHFTGMLAVDAMTPAGAFTFESVKLSLNNADGDATAEVKTYSTTTTVMVALTDGMLTIYHPNAVTDVTSVKVKISASGDDSTVTIGETVTVEVNVGKAAEGVPVVATSTTGAATDHTLQYKIGESGASTDLALLRGDNDTHFTSMLTVGLGTTAGTFTFESVKLSLQNAATDAVAAEVKTYTTETTSDVVVTLMDAGLTIDSSSGVTVFANATAADNTAGVGDKVTFTAWITNSTNGVPLNVTVNYKITGTKTVSDSVLLVNQGLNETGSSTNLWSGTFTIADNTTAGNLTIVSIVVWLENMDSSQTASLTLTAADAMATNVVKVDIPAPVDPPADNTTTSNTAATTASASASASSSESSSDSPVSIFAVFILIASVSMAVGVYTLRRRQ